MPARLAQPRECREARKGAGDVPAAPVCEVSAARAYAGGLKRSGFSFPFFSA